MDSQKYLLLLAFSGCGKFSFKTLKYGEVINSCSYINFVNETFKKFNKERGIKYIT